MVRHVPPVRNLRPGYTIDFPNRHKAGSHATKMIVVVLLLVSAGVMLIITLGGWSKLEGMKPVNFVWAVLYVIMAYYIARWNRGLLPLAAAMAILLLILALIAGTGIAGTSWFDRNHAGFGAPDTIFGGHGLGPDTLGLLTLLLAPIQILLIVFAMIGFAQGWNVEVEVPQDKAKRRGTSGSSASPPPEPAAA
jgi:hypothetical protein